VGPSRFAKFFEEPFHLCVNTLQILNGIVLQFPRFANGDVVCFLLDQLLMLRVARLLRCPLACGGQADGGAACWVSGVVASWFEPREGECLGIRSGAHFVR
jgi:hypothetical protein